MRNQISVSASGLKKKGKKSLTNHFKDIVRNFRLWVQILCINWDLFFRIGGIVNKLCLGVLYQIQEVKIFSKKYCGSL